MTRVRAAWEDVDDPEGRILKGMTCKWKGAHGTATKLKIIRLSAPTGLWWRSLREDDPEPFHRNADLTGGLMPCEEGDPGAVYQPHHLVAVFRYPDGESTTAKALSLEPWEEST